MELPSDLDAIDDFNPEPSVGNPPKARLPPRSHAGCWTCRSRKIKCDEIRPECTHCTRLGLTCDYNPRFSFRDDTLRVFEKSNSTRDLGPVWNSRRPLKCQRLNRSQVDHLPPFFSLTSDEDRERKAKLTKAGTYHVVVNPASFAKFGEYETSCTSSRVNRAGITHSPRLGKISEDPNVVILQVFEDDKRRAPLCGNSPLDQRRPSATSRKSSAPSSVSKPRKDHVCPTSKHAPFLNTESQDCTDLELFSYYKVFVNRHLGQVYRDTLGAPLETGALTEMDIFEKHAASFPPLYYALLAFSALSMHKYVKGHVGGLQHYQEALPSLQASLQTEKDLASDGIFLTHFILLLYEVAAGEERGLSLWSQHVTQLQKIILLRREINGSEPYSFIIWWISCIDIYVALTGMGNGDFVETMLQHNVLPRGNGSDARYHKLHAPRPPSPSPSPLAFHRRICVLAAELGLLARDLRKEAMIYGNNPNAAIVQQWQQRISVLQDNLRRTWKLQIPASVVGRYCNEIVPIEERGIFEHTYALYRALLIYSHTSMYPTQQTHHHPSSHQIPDEVSKCAAEILSLGRDIVSAHHLERKFIIFPLFMCGLVSTSRDERREILGLVRELEEDCVGRNLIATRRLLETVHEEQERRMARSRAKGGGCEGKWEDVDWVGLIAELGLQVVNCRL